MNGNPLTKAQTKAVQRAAAKGDFVDRLLMVLLHTGLTATEFTHMHDDWLEPLPESYNAYEGTTPIIRIAAEADCRRIRLDTNFQVLQRTGACGYCKERGYETWFPGQPESSCRVRTVPIPDETAVETLYWWFFRYDSTPISLNTINQRLSKLAVRASLDRNITPRDLRATYGTNLVRMGFDSQKIAKLMGWSDHKLTREFFEAAGKSVDWPTEVSDSTILAAVAENEPVTKPEVAKHVDMHRSAASKRINNLLERRLVREVGRRDTRGNPTTYGINPQDLKANGFLEVMKVYYQ